MKRYISIIAGVLTAAVIGMASIQGVSAVGTIADGVNSARGSQQPATLFGNSGVFSEISSVLLFIVGAVAVIMIVIGGLRYVISGGDASQVQAAKNTILYALVGIIVAILAYAAVNFVVGSLAPGSTGTGGGTGLGNGGATNYGTSTR